MSKLYTKEQIFKKYSDVYVDLYPVHYTLQDKNGNYITGYEVRGTSKHIRENYNLPIEYFK